MKNKWVWAYELLLIGAVAAVGILHTMVPDHWVPIALYARQHGSSKAETARAALMAGTGHVLFTLLIRRPSGSLVSPQQITLVISSMPR